MYFDVHVTKIAIASELSFTCNQSFSCKQLITCEQNYQIFKHMTEIMVAHSNWTNVTKILVMC